jgi:hypothetical protein
MKANFIVYFLFLWRANQILAFLNHHHSGYGYLLKSSVISRRLSSVSSRVANPTAKTPFISAEGTNSICRIKVVGVGGSGGNAVNRMLGNDKPILGVDFWSVNTDAQALSRNAAPNKVVIGKKLSRSPYFNK